MLLRDPIVRAYSEFRFCKATPHYCNIDGLNANSTFEALINATLNKFSGCFESDNPVDYCLSHSEVIKPGFYDFHIEQFMQGIPHTSLCVISNDFLATDQHKVLSIVEKFVGLDPFDWSSLEVSTDAEKITKSKHLGETADELPVSPSILKRLRDVFHEQPHVYYDHVKEWGFYGCRPNIAKTT